MWKWKGLFLTKNYLLKCETSLLNWIGALIIFLFLKLPRRKLEPWLVLWRFFLLTLPCISIILPYGHTRNIVIMSGLALLAATWNYYISYKIGYVRPLVLHLLPLEPLANHRNVASLNLFYRYYFGRCSSELAQLFPLPYSQGRSTRYSDRLRDFSVTIRRCY